MKKVAMIIVFVLLLAGCRRTENNAAAEIDSVPSGAELVYNHKTGFEQGIGHTYGSWSAPSSKGYFVIEFILNGGRLTGVSIEEKDPENNKKNIADLGDIHNNIIFSTQTTDTYNKTYAINIFQIKDFDGIVNVYFISL